MPVYEYKALDGGGKSCSGIIDADSMSQARQKLRSTGKFPVTIAETTSVPQARSSTSRQAFLTYFKRVRMGEVYALTRQLSTLLGAGVPLVSGLDALVRQTENTTLKKVIAEVKEAVNEGNSFTNALSEHPRLFSPIYINMVRAGEASGTLDVVLERLADFGENQLAIRGRFQAALIYPIFMTIIGTVILFFLVTYVVPNITSMFIEMKRALPLPTRILITVSDFCQSFWWVIVLAAIAVAVSLRMAIRTEKGRSIWDAFKLSVPIFGPVNQKLALARIGRTLGSLLQNSVSLITAMNIVRNVVNNVIVAKVIDEAAEQIQAGKSMTSVFAKSQLFPPMFVQMIAVGEQSGELEKMLGKAADSYDREVEASILGLTSMLEPLMILFMGLVVGFIVVSILLPIFEMNQMIR